jgi:hypothetical protein
MGLSLCHSLGLASPCIREQMRGTVLVKEQEFAGCGLTRGKDEDDVMFKTSFVE